jgi:hypothetical protein
MRDTDRVRVYVSASMPVSVSVCLLFCAPVRQREKMHELAQTEAGSVRAHTNHRVRTGTQAEKETALFRKPIMNKKNHSFIHSLIHSFIHY